MTWPLGSRGLVVLSLVGSTAAALALPGGSGGHLAAMAVALVTFAALLALEVRRPVLGMPAVAALSLVLLGMALVAPPRESTDVWAYTMYGRIWVFHHASPYVRIPLSFRGDPFFLLMSPHWLRMHALYGPGFLGLSGLVAGVAGRSSLVARLMFQLMAAGAVLASSFLVGRATRDRLAVAFLGLNPIVVVTVVNGGHNDALIGLALLGAVLLAERGRDGWAGAALGLAALIKVVALLPLAALVLWSLRRHGKAAAVRLGGAALTVAALGYAAAGPGSLAALRETSVTSPFSIWQLGRWVGSFLATGHPAHGLMWPFHPVVAVWTLPIVLVLAAAVALPRIMEDSPVFAVGGAMVAFLLSAPYVLPWYAMSALPALALRWRSLLAWTAQALPALLLGAYLLFWIPAALRPMPPAPIRSYVIGFLAADVALLAAVVLSAFKDARRSDRWPRVTASPA